MYKFKDATEPKFKPTIKEGPLNIFLYFIYFHKNIFSEKKKLSLPFSLYFLHPLKHIDDLMLHKSGKDILRLKSLECFKS